MSGDARNLSAFPNGNKKKARRSVAGLLSDDQHSPGARAGAAKVRGGLDSYPPNSVQLRLINASLKSQSPPEGVSSTQNVYPPAYVVVP